MDARHGGTTCRCHGWCRWRMTRSSRGSRLLAMAHRKDTLVISTRGRGLTDVTKSVEEVVAASNVRTGLCTLFVRHTSASVVVQENADPAVLRDLQRWMDWVAPERP